MKIISSGGIHTVFPNADCIKDSLPNGFYEVVEIPFQGLKLADSSPITKPNFKIYGDNAHRIERIFKRLSFSQRQGNNNSGVLLSGIKGSGKTILLRELAAEANSMGYPVITVNSAFGGLNSFIGSIKQPCVFLFDEFEKTFDTPQDQNNLLTLIDGAEGKNGHLFVFAINNRNKVSDYFFNRPGRIHYHYRYDLLDEELIKEYLTDNIEDGSQLGKALHLCKQISCTYDVLQAICYEINTGCDVNNILSTINTESKEYFDIVVKLKDGKEITTYSNSKGNTYMSVIIPPFYREKQDVLGEIFNKSNTSVSLDTFKEQYLVKRPNVDVEISAIEVNEKTGVAYISLDNETFKRNVISDYGEVAYENILETVDEIIVSYDYDIRKKKF